MMSRVWQLIRMSHMLTRCLLLVYKVSYTEPDRRIHKHLNKYTFEVYKTRDLNCILEMLKNVSLCAMHIFVKILFKCNIQSIKL